MIIIIFLVFILIIGLAALASDDISTDVFWKDDFTIQREMQEQQEQIRRQKKQIQQQQEQIQQLKKRDNQNF